MLHSTLVVETSLYGFLCWKDKYPIYFYNTLCQLLFKHIQIKNARNTNTRKIQQLTKADRNPVGRVCNHYGASTNSATLPTSLHVTDNLTKQLQLTLTAPKMVRIRTFLGAAVTSFH